MAILYDARIPIGSIATFRDIGDDNRYTLVPRPAHRPHLVVSVSPTTAKLREDDFGTSHEQTYSLRKPEDEKP